MENTVSTLIWAPKTILWNHEACLEIMQQSDIMSKSQNCWLIRPSESGRIRIDLSDIIGQVTGSWIEGDPSIFKIEVFWIEPRFAIFKAASPMTWGAAGQIVEGNFTSLQFISWVLEPPDNI
jgi:hypothetical protein